MAYLAAISKVFIEVLEDLVLEVTVTVTTHKTPGVKPVIVVGFAEIDYAQIII